MNEGIRPLLEMPPMLMDASLRELRLLFEAMGAMAQPDRDEQRTRIVDMVEAIVKVATVVIIQSPATPPGPAKTGGEPAP